MTLNKNLRTKNMAKIRVLAFILINQIVTAQEVAKQFNYKGSPSILWRLLKFRLVERTKKDGIYLYTLTPKGQAYLQRKGVMVRVRDDGTVRISFQKGPVKHFLGI